jgi:hypothetical protein
MDFNTAIDIIIKDLRQAREIIDDFKKYSGVPLFQVELAKSKCKSAEEIIALLKNIKQDFEKHQVMEVEGVEGVEEVEEVEGVEKVSEKRLSEQVSQIDLFEISDEDESESPSAAINTEIVPEILFKSEGKSLFTESDSVVTQVVKDKLPDTNIVADKFSGMSNTFNEQLGNIISEDDISAVIKSRPVANLTEAIGINDKFLFIREIFNGNQSFYNEAIAKLNKVENLPDAKAVIMSYTGVDDENEAVKQLLDLVKRKLPSDE